jgi:hypothetical protein
MMNEGEQIHRSSHALVDNLDDIDTDANSAADLFETLKDRDCVVFAHIGGRYADIRVAHDQRLERAVEVHSAWGTFEWLVEDAFEQGFRVGIVSNSDGHKGRPGASHPGATKFGSYGGLTCMLATELSRSAIMESLRKRHHYGTTGCRSILKVEAAFTTPSRLYSEDPNTGSDACTLVSSAIMGDIVASEDNEVTLNIEVVASAPIERIDIRNGLDTVEIYRPYSNDELGHRIRVLWEGSEYRGRGRETIWDGFASISGNSFEKVLPINRYNLDKKFDLVDNTRLEWTALTTGGFGGFDAFLADPTSGIMEINTALVKTQIAVDSIQRDEQVFANGGIDRRIRVFRLPDDNPHNRVSISRKLKIRRGQDNAFYVRVTQEDGHFAWSSPIYLIEGPGVN